MQNVHEQALEELERVICVREKLRQHWRRLPAQHALDETERMSQLTLINELIHNLKDAMLVQNPVAMEDAILESKRTP